jgi:hypothetical protein
MSDKKIAKQMAGILRILAAKIEENPEILKDVGLNFIDIPTSERKKKEKVPVDFGIFEVFAKGGEEALRQKLEAIEMGNLKQIISQHGFVPSKLAGRWRTKEPLINLIVERVTARSDKGRVFKEYP